MHLNPARRGALVLAVFATLATVGSLPAASPAASRAVNPAVSSAAAPPAPQDDPEAMIEQLEDARDGYEVVPVSRAFADVRGVDAMEARVRIYDDKLELRGGVNLRDWLYTGMIRAADAAETEVLLEAAADRKHSDLLRLVCLRALRRGEAPVPAEPCFDRALQRLDGELGRAWQNTLGALLAQQRLVFDPDDAEEQAAALRVLLLEAGMPFLGHRWLAPTADEVALIAAAAADADDPADRAQLLHVLAPHARPGHPGYRAWLTLARRALRDEARAPRIAVAEAAARAGIAAAAEPLIEALERLADAPPSRYPRDYAAALRTLTGQQYAADGTAWRRWWERSGEDWLAAAQAGAALGAPAAAVDPDAHETVASVFGIALDSDRVGFLVDGSGSMTRELGDGRRCSEAAADEFEALLGQLPDEAVFHLHIIVHALKSPFDEAVRATRRNRNKAIDFVRRFDYGPASAMYDALLAVQQTPEIDTLIFVSDGGGSWGSFAYRGHMLDGLSLAHKRTGVRIHAVCVGKDAQHAGFMRELAELTGGRMSHP